VTVRRLTPAQLLARLEEEVARAEVRLAEARREAQGFYDQQLADRLRAEAAPAGGVAA
jgi:hypothetical protein